MIRVAGWASTEFPDCVDHSIAADGIEFAALDGSAGSPKVLWTHDGRSIPVGRIRSLSVRKFRDTNISGLWAEVDVIHQQLEALLIHQKLSFSGGFAYIDGDFMPYPGDPDRELLRIHRCRMLELSIVNDPCNFQSQMLEVGDSKSAEPLATAAAAARKLKELTS